MKTGFIDAIGVKDLNADEIYSKMPCLVPENITSGVLYILSAPHNVNVSIKKIKKNKYLLLILIK